MSMIGEAFIRVRPDTTGFRGQVNRDVKSGMGGVGTIIKSALAIGGVVAGFRALSGAIRVGIKEYSEQAKVAAQTNAVLKSTGGIANVTAKDVTGLANALMRKTGIDDEQIAAAENWLLTFKNVRNEVGAGNQIFDRATVATLDLARARANLTGGEVDLASASTMLGKALNDPIKGMTAMGRAGVTFSASQREAIKALVESGDVLGAQKLILKEVESQLGKSAEAYGKTLPGQIDILKQTFSNLAGEVVSKLVPVLTQFVGFINEHMPQISAAASAMGAAVSGAFSALAGAVSTHWGSITTVVRTSVAILQGTFTLLRGVLTPVLQFLGTDMGQRVAIGVAALYGFVRVAVVVKAAFETMKIAAMAFGKSLIANPWTAALALFVGFVAAVVVPGILGGNNIMAESYRRLKGTIDELQGSIDKLNGANLNLEQAHLRVKTSVLGVEQAEKNYAVAIETSGKKSLEARTAFSAVQQARLDHKRAVLDLNTAEKEHADAQATRRAEIAATSKEILLQRDAAETASQQAVQLGDAVAGFAGDMIVAAAGSVDMAAKLREVDPAAAKAAEQAAKMAIAAHDLAVELGRVPTKVEIIARAKVVDLEKYKRELAEMPRAADVAGKGAVKGLATGAAGLAALARTLGSGAVTSFSSGGSGATSAGQTIGGNLKAGFIAGMGGLVAQAAAIAGAAVAAVASAASAKAENDSPSGLMIREVGIPLAQGIIVGFQQGLATMAQVIGQTLGAALSQGYMSVGSSGAEAASSKVGIPTGQGVVAGYIIGTQDLPQKMAEGMRNAIEAARRVIDEKRSTLSTAFSQLASDVLSAFDRITGEIQTKSEKALASLDAAEQARQLKEAIVGARQGVAEAKAELAKFDELAATAGTAESELTPEAMAAKRAELNKAIETEEQRLHDALIAKQRAGLQARAAEERKALDDRLALKRRHLAEDLADLEKALTKQGATHDTYQKAVIALFKKYGINYKASGLALGVAFAQGLRESIAEVERAATSVATAAQKKLKLESPAKEGPLSTLDTWWSPFSATLLKGLDADRIGRAVSAAAAPPSGRLRGGVSPPALDAALGRPLSAVGSSNEAILLELRRQTALLAEDRQILVQLRDNKHGQNGNDAALAAVR